MWFSDGKLKVAFDSRWHIHLANVKPVKQGVYINYLDFDIMLCKSYYRASVCIIRFRGCLLVYVYIYIQNLISFLYHIHSRNTHPDSQQSQTILSELTYQAYFWIASVYALVRILFNTTCVFQHTNFLMSGMCRRSLGSTDCVKENQQLRRILVRNTKFRFFFAINVEIKA